MKHRLVGSILMMLGTSIGAGMLALPVATAYETYLATVLLLFVSWLAMTIGAFALLEVNLWMKPGANIITMAANTLGKYAKWASWLVYLVLLYSLLCAYLSSSGDLLQALLASIHILIPRWLATILALLLLGSIVYRGVSSIDIVNRGLMSIKLISCIILILAILPHIKLDYVLVGDFKLKSSVLMVMLTSFGYAIIVPSLRYYLKSDVKLLKKGVLIGSLLPFVLYLLWITSIQGLVPRYGYGGLLHMLHSANTNSLLMASVSRLMHYRWLTSVAKLFISICAVTSFLGVSLCLTDFVADGLQVVKKSKGAPVIYAISYLPPLLIVLLAPGIFIKALSYAGICCVFILILLPIMMLYSGRYIKHYKGSRILWGGKVLIYLAAIFVVAILLLY